MMQIINCEQGSPEWYSARLGIPTASRFATVMAVGKQGGSSVTRKEYMMKLAGEIITGELMDNFVSSHMERGKVQEDEARDLYSFMTDADPIRVGFVRNGDRGCSPDSFIGDNGGLEIKTALPHIQIDRLLRGTLPTEHRAQVQGSIWLCERKFWDFCSYCPKLPLFVVRVERDEEYIAQLEKAVDQFNAELKQLVETIMSFHAKEAA